MAIDWSQVKSRKIRDAFRVALSDKLLSHAEIVDVLRKTLDDGYLTQSEVADLVIIARTSETIMPRSRQMINYLTIAFTATILYGPIYFATEKQKYAANLVCDFLKRMGSPYFPKFDRDIVGIDLLLRVANPSIINQNQATICGPVSVLYNAAFDQPARYAKYGIDLFERGKANLGEYEIKPNETLRNSSPPAQGISQGDWMTGASFRASLSTFDEVADDGSITGSQVATLLKRSGYSDVHFYDDPNRRLDPRDIDRINKLFNSGYRVVLFIDSGILQPAKQKAIVAADQEYGSVMNPANLRPDPAKDGSSR